MYHHDTYVESRSQQAVRTARRHGRPTARTAAGFVAAEQLCPRHTFHTLEVLLSDQLVSHSSPAKLASSRLT